MTDIEISLDLTRYRIRRSILESMRELQEVQGIEKREIIAELLSIAWEAVSRSETEINDYTIPALSNTESEPEEEYDNGAEEQRLEWDLLTKFWHTDIHKKVESMADEGHRLVRLERYTELVKLNEQILFQLSGHLDMWAKVVGNDKYSNHNHFFYHDYLMRAYVVLLDREKLERVRSSVVRLNSIAKFVDQEVFDMDYRRFEKDMDVMKAIYEFLKENPLFPQKKLFATLSIPGRQCTYMLDWANKLNRIKRVRSKDTWLLSIATD